MVFVSIRSDAASGRVGRPEMGLDRLPREDFRQAFTRPEWLAEATAWIRERVAVTGEIEQFHVRWWSTVLRVPTAAGDLLPHMRDA